MNLLICSVGRRVKLVEYFKNELQKINGKVIAVDCDPTAAALHFADIHEVVPRIDHPEYIEYIKRICDKYKIRGILSLIDPELTLLASYKEEFKKLGISVIVSDKKVVDICFDKFLTYKFLQENNLPSVPTYLDLDSVIQDLKNGSIKFPLIVKPKNGSASIGIMKVSSIEELRLIEDKNQELIVQPFIFGEEFGVDCYIDLLTNKATNIFIKKKIAMRSGETDKSIALKDPELKNIIEKLIVALRPNGPIDIDCFKTANGYVISEINPRFGGGYLHSHEMGQNFVKNIINNLKGEHNVINEGDYEEGTMLIKYDNFIVLNASANNQASLNKKVTIGKN